MNMRTTGTKLAGLAVVIGLMAVAPAGANVLPIDPSVGLTTSFSWSSGLAPADDSFTITVSGPSTIDVTLEDCCVPGDEFALKLDGTLVAWTSSGYSASVYSGFADNVFLSTGAHTFTIELTALAPGYTDGGATAMFSAAVPAVPEPESYMLALGGLAVSGWFARRRQA